MSGKPWRSPFFIAGISIWALCAAAWGVAWILDARIAGAMGAAFAAFLVGGKFAGIPTGLSLGLPEWLVAPIMFVPDAGAVLVTYPLMEKGWEVAGRWSMVLAGVRDRAVKNAKDRKGILARFESFGLFVLTMTPIGFVSPIVVAAIGQVMGLSARRVLIPVFAGMVLMTVLLVAGFGAGLRAAARIHPMLPFLLTGTIILVILSREVQLRLRARRQRQREPEGS